MLKKHKWLTKRDNFTYTHAWNQFLKYPVQVHIKNSKWYMESIEKILKIGSRDVFLIKFLSIIYIFYQTNSKFKLSKTEDNK